ncbi:MAG: CCA tRNA nucleotidyltransferase [Halobacteriaceae archaeon]
MSDDDAVAAAVAAVADRVHPTDAERRRLDAAVDDLLERTRAAVSDLPVEADVLQVGSTARGTWIRGDRDIDVFVRFPPDLDRERLERYGLQVGRAVLQDGEEEYAEHPYVTGEYAGFDVDLVPCYRVDSASDIRSAVDRTPFHTTYVADRLDADGAAEVRLLKQFLVGIGAYGSDLRTRGFSGYLTELLVLAYGSFRDVLAAAADWRPPVELDPADHAAETFDDPLVVVDPTDPGRNVAAVVSEANVARLTHYARTFLADPSPEAFVPDPPDPLDPAEVREHLSRRGTAPLAIRFDAPDLVDDQLYPQLRRSLDGLRRGLEGAGFEVLRATTVAADAAVLFVECATGELPAVERHVGPPVATRSHATGFYETYADAAVYGPFLDGDRYVVERERSVRTVEEFARERLLEVALGAHVEDALREGYGVLVGDEVATLADAFGVELARYFDPTP